MDLTFYETHIQSLQKSFGFVRVAVQRYSRYFHENSTTFHKSDQHFFFKSVIAFEQRG
jgi:hypothetical protein